jgi:thiol-disulfide isomerase/thioredoxin
VASLRSISTSGEDGVRVIEGSSRLVRFYHAIVTRRLVVPLIAAIMLAGTACGGGQATSFSSPARIVRAAPLLPTDVASLPPMDVAGFHRLLGQLRGTPVVVNVWGSWCAPCIAEAPLLASAAERHLGVQFLGVDIQDSRNGAVSFIQKYRIPYPSVFDPTAAIRTDLGSFGQPDTYFFDTRGQMVARYDGQIAADTLEADLAKIST